MRNVPLKITFVNRYFYPDHSATSQLLSDLAFDLAHQGLEVEVVTSRQLYDKSAAALESETDINGVHVWRVWTTRMGRQQLLGRAIDYLTFYLSAAWRLIVITRSGDIVVAMTDPPLISVVAAVVVKLRGAKLVNWVQDLFPEVAIALSVRIPASVGKLAVKIRNWSLRQACSNVALGERMAKCLLDNGIPFSQIGIIHNWSSEDHIVPLSRDVNQFRGQWGLKDKFVVGYSGNMGRAHEFDTILGAAQSLLDDERVVFLFIGGGAQKSYIEEQAKVRRLTNVVFKPYQPRKDLALSLCVPDIHLISLFPELEGLIVPSKFYGIAAAGRPTIYIGDLDGEIPRILRDGGCGEVVEIGSSNSLYEIIHSHAGQYDEIRAMGKRARQIFERRFTSRRALNNWVDVLDRAARA